MDLELNDPWPRGRIGGRIVGEGGSEKNVTLGVGEGVGGVTHCQRLTYGQTVVFAIA